MEEKKKKNGVDEETPSSHKKQPSLQVEEQVKSSNQNIPMEDNTKNAENEVAGSSSSFPVARINRIIRSEAADIRITQEANFLINKATEQFLEQFCGEAYTRVAREHRKAVEYKHISSVVSEGKRYDFLSDFVPEKVRAEDALSERLAGI